MEKDLLQLKLALVQNCTELQNVTIKDLQDLKWITKQKLILSLVSKSPLFSDECDEIEQILEQRNTEVLALKSMNSSKEEKLESEARYRTSILRVYLRCAEKLKWPKALEAFSDPLQDLMDDKVLFLNSIKYFTENLFTIASCKSAKKMPGTPKAVVNLAESTLQPKDDIVSVTVHDARMEISRLSEGNIHEEHQFAKAAEEYSDNFITPRSNIFRNPQSRADQIQTQMVYSQNKRLISEIKALKEHVSKRKILEKKLRNIAQDLSSSIDEIATITGKTDSKVKGPWSQMHAKLNGIMKQLDDIETNHGVEKEIIDNESFGDRIPKSNIQNLLNKKLTISQSAQNTKVERYLHLLQIMSFVLENTENEELQFWSKELFRSLMNNNIDVEMTETYDNDEILSTIERLISLISQLKITKEKRENVDELCFLLLQEISLMKKKIFLLEKLSQTRREVSCTTSRANLRNKKNQNEEEIQVLHAILDSLHHASSATIFSKKNEAREPIKMLRQGYLGAETAHLITTLVVNSEALKSLIRKLS